MKLMSKILGAFTGAHSLAELDRAIGEHVALTDRIEARLNDERLAIPASAREHMVKRSEQGA